MENTGVIHYAPEPNGLDDKKLWLGRYQQYSHAITSAQVQIRMLRERAAMLGGYQSDTVRGGRSDWTDLVDRIADKEAELKRQIAIWLDAQQEISAAIRAVDHAVYRSLLEYRYLCGWDWSRIAAKMNYSQDRIWHLHPKALEKIRIPDKNDRR